MYAISEKIKSTIDDLSTTTDKSFYLSILRLYVAFHIFRNVIAHWGSMELIIGDNSVFPVYYTGTIIQFAINNYQLFFFLVLILCILFFFGVGKHITVILLTIVLEIYQDITPYLLNGGDNYLKLIMVYLIFADSYKFFSITKLKIKNIELQRFSNFLTNLMVYAILFHLCLIYFISGIEKLHSKEWFNGVALYYILNLERFSGTPFNSALANNGWFVNIGTYLVMFFELYFPVLIWNKRLRIPLAVFGIMMHLGILVFMMLYDFQVIFIVIYGLFFTNKEWFSFLNKIKERIPAIRGLNPTVNPTQ